MQVMGTCFFQESLKRRIEELRADTWGCYFEASQLQRYCTTRTTANARGQVQGEYAIGNH